MYICMQVKKMKKYVIVNKRQVESLREHETLAGQYGIEWEWVLLPNGPEEEGQYAQKLLELLELIAQMEEGEGDFMIEVRK